MTMDIDDRAAFFKTYAQNVTLASYIGKGTSPLIPTLTIKDSYTISEIVYDVLLPSGNCYSSLSETFLLQQCHEDVALI